MIIIKEDKVQVSMDRIFSIEDDRIKVSLDEIFSIDLDFIKHDSSSALPTIRY